MGQGAHPPSFPHPAQPPQRCPGKQSQQKNLGPESHLISAHWGQTHDQQEAVGASWGGPDSPRQGCLPPALPQELLPAALSLLTWGSQSSR